MKATILRYSIYASITIVILALIQFFFIVDKASYPVQEAAGYLSMLISMIFVFLGIRHFRDHINGGTLTFGQGLKIGVMIVLMPAVFFGLFDILYTQVIDPSWSNHYFTHYIEEAKKTIPSEKLAEELKKIEAQQKLFSNPAMQFLLMSVTVFIIGLIVAIISALSLRRTKHAITDLYS